jgi:predicted N-acetyltransferase YhbS
LDKIEYRNSKPNDVEGITELLNLVFNGWPKIELNCSETEHWKWKHLDNPLHESIVTIALDDDKVVGCSHTIIKEIKIGVNKYLTGIGCDAAVHPDYQSRGIYSKLRDLKRLEEEKLGLRYRHVISENPKLVNRNVRMGNYVFPHQVTEYNKIFKINEFLSDYGKDKQKIMIGYYYLTGLNKVKNLFTKKNNVNEIDIIEVDNFGPDIEILWNKLQKEYEFTFVRDYNYLKWRFCDKRSGDFKMSLAFNKGELHGYIVTKIDRYLKYPIGYIVDQLASNDAVTPLIKTAVENFTENNVNFIRCWNLHNQYSRALEQQGFIPNPRRRMIFFEKGFTSQEEIESICKMSTKKILFSMGDHDYI